MVRSRVWSYDAKNLMRGSVVIAPVKDVPGVRYGAYIGDYMGRMTAVNAETGASLWTIQVDSHPGAKISIGYKTRLSSLTPPKNKSLKTFRSILPGPLASGKIYGTRKILSV